MGQRRVSWGRLIVNASDADFCLLVSLLLPGITKRHAAQHDGAQRDGGGGGGGGGESKEPTTGFEPVTSSLPRTRSYQLSYVGWFTGGERRIRTFEGKSRQIYSLFPLTARESPRECDIVSSRD